MTEGEPVVPDGRRIVWDGARPAAEGVPLRLPGVVVRDLPEGQALIAWVDRQGFQCPDAVYDTKWLTPVTDEEFDRLVTELRGSDWAGLPPRAPFDEPEEQPLLRVGASIRWIGPLRGDVAWEIEAWRAWYPAALGGVLEPSHPGIVTALDYRGDPIVKWTDKDGEFQGRLGVARSLVVEITVEEALRRAEGLRASEWPGLDASDPA